MIVFDIFHMWYVHKLHKGTIFIENKQHFCEKFFVKSGFY